MKLTKGTAAQPTSPIAASSSFPPAQRIRALYNAAAGPTVWTPQGSVFISGGANTFAMQNRPKPGGVGMSGTVDSPNISWEFNLPTPGPINAEQTVFALFFYPGSGGNFQICNYTSLPGESCFLSINAGVVTGGTFRANTNVSANAALVTGTVCLAVYTVKANDQRLWINGVKQTAQQTQPLSVFEQAKARFIVYGTERAFVYAAGAYDRALQDVEIAQLTANPWQLFAPRRIWVPVAAAGGATLPTLSNATFVPGSVTATSFRPRVTATY